MSCILVRLFVVVLVIEKSTSSSRDDPTPSCPPHWSLLGGRCFAFYPVWSSWSVASSLCSQTGGHLVSLHTPEDVQFVLQLANSNVPVWLGGYQEQQNGSWFWSDGSSFRSSNWTNQEREKVEEGGACMEMDLKSGELNSAPCGELRFYICSTRASSASSVCSSSSSKKLLNSDIVPGVSLFDVVWSNNDLLAEETLMSSSFLGDLRDGRVTERRYSDFMQQEALCLHRVGGTLEALIVNNPVEAGDMRSLLIDTLEQYNSRNQSLVDSPPPKWLQYSLQTLHSVVLEEPVYWLVALSARAGLRNYLAKRLLAEVKPPTSESGLLYQEWSQESLKEAAWIDRYKKVLEEHQDQVDTYKAINIFREHMVNQKSLYKYV
ncbi:uncharacterized protein LOC125014776 [Mugil cephalus]|uniref:uncharacterized protein LOC125014776 n=1 Tax=Mugil cephalus TaxID=48193 RepID=UPI001FB5CC11|nr:uncharacterized protein LOC125014776 [Mugil cephalus]XP_047452126.1 uncharacterized protein LOC125014776 [Mugil cephalus]